MGFIVLKQLIGSLNTGFSKHSVVHYISQKAWKQIILYYLPFKSWVRICEMDDLIYKIHSTKDEIFSKVSVLHEHIMNNLKVLEGSLKNIQQTLVHFEN